MMGWLERNTRESREILCFEVEFTSIIRYGTIFGNLLSEIPGNLVISVEDEG